MSVGRPLRFLAVALGGWVTIRIAVLLPDIASLPASEVIPRVIAVLVPQVAAAGLGRPRPVPATARPLYPQPDPKPLDERRLRASPSIWALPLLSPMARYPPPEHLPQPDRVPSPIGPPVVVSGASRLTGSAWLLARGGAAGTVSGGQLGASQAGLRLAYALGERRRVALVARLATPLEGAGREAALGVEWQPTTLPIRLVAEQRFALDTGRGGPTLGVIAGYGPADIAPGLRVEAYGQAGAIVRGGVEGFVDASARVTHPLARIAGARIDIGFGAWGSAQRAAERFDLGPSLVATMPVAGKSVRLTLDWRERVAGAARPGSGPALSIGSDF